MIFICLVFLKSLKNMKGCPIDFKTCPKYNVDIDPVMHCETDSSVGFCKIEFPELFENNERQNIELHRNLMTDFM